MSPEAFCYWLQGFVELTGECPTPEQWEAIKQHLAIAFVKITPPLEHHPATMPLWEPMPPLWGPGSGRVIC